MVLLVADSTLLGNMPALVGAKPDTGSYKAGTAPNRDILLESGS
jgi:hypothetical protein